MEIQSHNNYPPAKQNHKYDDPFTKIVYYLISSK